MTKLWIHQQPWKILSFITRNKYTDVKNGGIWVWVIILSPLWISELLGVTPKAIPKRITEATGQVLNWNAEDLILLRAMESWANSRDFCKSWFPTP